MLPDLIPYRSPENSNCDFCVFSELLDGEFRCHHGSPTSVLDENGVLRATWPIVYAKGWCGQHAEDGEKFNKVHPEQAKREHEAWWQSYKAEQECIQRMDAM